MQTPCRAQNVRQSVEDSGIFDDSSSVSGDFEWDESSHRSPTAAPTDVLADGTTNDPNAGRDGEEDPNGDGMATLAVGDSQDAYFGVASGAALLRIIYPDALQSTPPPGSGSRSASDLNMQPFSR